MNDDHSAGRRTIARPAAAGRFDVAGRVAVVTGGASGLGAAIAAGLAQADAKVVVLDQDADRAVHVASQISSDGNRALALQTDVRNADALKHAADRVCAEYGHVDILVNSAGVAHRSPAETFTEEAYDLVLAVNLKGTFFSCQAFGQKMLDQGAGSIINMASIGGMVAYPHAAAYLASKGGVVQLTRGLALEWIDRGVRVNAIAPTLFDTPLTRGVAEVSTVTSDFIRRRGLRGDEPVTDPTDVVGAAIFLASDASHRVTGHTLPVDDGYLIV